MPEELTAEIDKKALLAFLIYRETYCRELASAVQAEADQFGEIKGTFLLHASYYRSLVEIVSRTL